MKSQTRNRLSGHRRQQGATLAVALILLTVITILGLSSMRNTNLDAKIAANHQHKQISFQAAESALSKLTAPSPEKSDGGVSLKVPKTVQEDDGSGNMVYKPALNPDYYQATGVDGQPDASADLDLLFTEQSRPGKYKFSGFGLSIVTLIYQGDAKGEINNSNAKSQNRMQVALIRE